MDTSAMDQFLGTGDTSGFDSSAATPDAFQQALSSLGAGIIQDIGSIFSTGTTAAQVAIVQAGGLAPVVTPITQAQGANTSAAGTSLSANQKMFLAGGALLVAFLAFK